MKLKEIPTNTVVHTPTEAEAQELLAILHENGWTVCEPLDYIVSEAKGISIYPKPHWGWWENINNATLNGSTIITLADFKRLYSVEEQPQSKFKVGDKVRVVTNDYGLKDAVVGVCEIIKVMSHGYHIKSQTGVWFAKESDLEPYTEPETKPTEDMETKDEAKELNLVEVLQGHEGETFYSPMFGERALIEIGDGDYPISFGEEEFYDFGIDGCWSDGGMPLLFPSRALYEQYPLDAAKAWSVWQEEQKPKHYIEVHYGVVNGIDENLNEVLFRTSSDRDKCIEEIKEKLKEYSN